MTDEKQLKDINKKLILSGFFEDDFSGEIQQVEM
jgi:hypothetical protein